MANKAVVVYRSKTGYTKTYAGWIAEELNCDIKENKKLKYEDLMDYDTIIYGGGLFASRIRGIDLIKQNFNYLKAKNVIVFMTGMVRSEVIDMDNCKNNNFDDEQKNNIKTFYFRGGFDYKKLGTVDKIIISGLKKKLISEKNPSETVKDMLKMYDGPSNFTDKKSIKPLIAYVRESL